MVQPVNDPSLGKTPQSAGVLRALVVGIALGLVATIAIAFMIPLSDQEDQTTVPGADNPTIGTQPSLVLPLPVTEVKVPELSKELEELSDKLQKQYPGDVAALHFAAQIHSELEQTDKAEALWKECLAQSPLHMGPYVGMATLLMEKGRNEEAVETLLKAQKLGGTAPEMLLKLGEAYENLGDLDHAIQYLKEGVAQYPEDSNLWLVQGRVLNQLGQSAEAENSLRRSIAMAGESEPALYALNAALVRQGKTQDAISIREKLAAIKKPKEVQGDVFQARYDSALTRIAADVMISAGTLAEANKQMDEAKRLYLRAFALNPKNAMSLQGLLGIAHSEQQVGDQKQLLVKLLELQPDNIVNYTNLASVAMQLGETSLAEQTLQKAVAVDPQGILAQAALAKYYLSVNQPAQARDMAAQVIERQPSAAAYRLLAATYQAEGLEAAYNAANRKADELELASSPTAPTNAKPQ